MRVCDRCRSNKVVDYAYIPCCFDDATVQYNGVNLKEIDLCEECRRKILKVYKEFLNNDNYTV